MPNTYLLNGWTHLHAHCALSSDHKLHNIFVNCNVRISLHCRAIITEAVNIISTRNGRIKGIYNRKSAVPLEIVNWYGLRGLVIAWWCEKEGGRWIGLIWACPVGLQGLLLIYNLKKDRGSPIRSLEMLQTIWVTYTQYCYAHFWLGKTSIETTYSLSCELLKMSFLKQSKRKIKYEVLIFTVHLWAEDVPGVNGE